MAWTDKASMLLGVNEPARSVDINAIYDNVEAMCNGDAGAPEITEAALDTNVTTKLNAGANGARLGAPTAGTTFVNKLIGEVNSAGFSANMPEEQGSFFSPVSACAVTDGNVTITVDGSFTFSIGTATLRVKTYKNDTIITTTDYTTAATIAVSDDIAVVQGDVVYYTLEVLNVTGGASGNYSSTGAVKTGNDVLGVL